MNGIFKQVVWNSKPPTVQPLKGGKVRVTRKVEAYEETDAESGATTTAWRGEAAVMTEAAYMAYAGAMEAEQKREVDVIDDYTLKLIEEGVL